MARRISRQQQWSLKKHAEGRCSRCGSELESYRWLCDSCQEKNTKYMKKYRKAQRKALEAKAQILGGRK